jgi:hypothetical protein
VLAIVVGLLLTVVVALGIVALVALPHLRQGSRILTPHGQRAVKRAKQQAKEKPLAAAGGTWHGLVALKRVLGRSGGRIARVWAPVSTMLHEAMDHLENRDSRADTASSTPSPSTATAATSAVDPATVPSATERVRSGTARVTTGSVGRPRSTPMDSGPIPEIPAEQSVRTGSGATITAERNGRVIDLRVDPRRDAHGRRPRSAHHAR